MAKMSTPDLLELFEQMTVLELKEFLDAFEERFDVTAAAPMAMAAAGGGAAAAPVEEEKDEFTVMLTGAGAQKIQVIKEVRSLTSLGLKEAKDLVDGAPKAVLEGVDKAAAEKAKAQLEAVGASVELQLGLALEEAARRLRSRAASAARWPEAVRGSGQPTWRRGAVASRRRTLRPPPPPPAAIKRGWLRPSAVESSSAASRSCPSWRRTSCQARWPLRRLPNVAPITQAESWVRIRPSRLASTVSTTRSGSSKAERASSQRCCSWGTVVVLY